MANVDVNMEAGYTNANAPSALNPLATLSDIDLSVAKIKFGSYAGNGTSQPINVGFQPDWVLLYNADDNTQSGVYVARGGAGRFFRTSGTADVTITGTGFTLNNGTAPLNQSPKNYFYIAIQGNN